MAINETFSMTNGRRFAMVKSLKPKTQTKEPRFEDALERLEKIVQEMESGDLPLEEILKKYEEGSKLMQVCTAKLNEAEKRIEILMKDKEGALSLKPFEEKEAAEENETAGKEKPEDDENEEKEDKDLF